MRRILAASCLVFGLIAPPALADDDALAGGEWVLAGETGKHAPYLRFDADRVAGLGGCNRFGGTYERKGDSLAFSPLAATRMACPGELMQKEQAFFTMLGAVKAMKLDGERLELLDGEGKVLATFDRRVAE